MTMQYTYLIIFGFLAYLILTDSSIARFFSYVSDLLKFKLYKTWWWTLNNPRNPILKYIMWRQAIPMDKELQKEYQEKK